MHLARAALLMALCCAPLCRAQEVGVTVRDLDLLTEPRSGAALAGKLKQDERVTLLRRDKSWAEVSNGKIQGWVFFFYLSWVTSDAKPDTSREIVGVFGLATGRQSGQVTSVLGIRGISEEQLKSAKFNADELKRMEAHAVGRQAADGFAKEGGLAPRQVSYLPAPAPSAPAGNDGGRQ